MFRNTEIAKPFYGTIKLKELRKYVIVTFFRLVVVKISSLETINFNEGIRSEKIQNNFEKIDNQIRQERLSIGGTGIRSGLEITVNDFTIEISSGCVIDADGEELFFNDTRKEISKPKLFTSTNQLYNVQTGGKIILDKVPYKSDRTAPVNDDCLNEVNVVDVATNTSIEIRKIENNILTVDSYYTDKQVRVTYSYTDKRYDTVFINEENKIDIYEGTTSPSASLYLPEHTLCVLGYLEIEPFYRKENLVSAKVSVITSSDSKRRIYVDEDNNLWLNGTKFDNLQIIHMEKPDNPYVDELWYDSDSNKLMVYKNINGIKDWIEVNSVNHLNLREHKTWNENENPDDAIFIFNKADAQYHFMPNRNALTIMVDNYVLHSDQFREITLTDLKNNPLFRNIAYDKGYTDSYISAVNSDYENEGIGFQIIDGLDKKCFVECIVTHIVKNNPLKDRFQRTATFSKVGTYKITDTSKNIISFNEGYRYGEHQLELFLNGIKLIEGLEYSEGNINEYEYEDGVQTYPQVGNLLKSVTIKKDLPSNSYLEYVITTTIFSYDHLNALIDSSQQGEILKIKEELLEANANLKSEVDFAVSNLTNEVNSIKTKAAEHDNFVKKDEKINIDIIDDTLKRGIAKGVINKVTKVKDIRNYISGISEKDFLQIYEMSTKRLYVRKSDDVTSGYDYEVIQTGNSARIVFQSTVDENTELYITGISFY